MFLFRYPGPNLRKAVRRMNDFKHFVNIAGMNETAHIQGVTMSCVQWMLLFGKMKDTVIYTHGRSIS